MAAPDPSLLRGLLLLATGSACLCGWAQGAVDDALPASAAAAVKKAASRAAPARPAAVHRPASSAPRKASTLSPRCESLLQRSGLGDPLTPDEQTEMRRCQ